jgi:CheY-like chemotaxis protein
MKRISHILIVDDDEQVLGLLTTALSREGYVITAVNSGNEALRLLENRSFDLLLLDLGMPEMDGFELLKLARAHDSHLKIVVISGMSQVLLKAAELFGAVASISKPISPELLRNTIATVVADASSNGKRL